MTTEELLAQPYKKAGGSGGGGGEGYPKMVYPFPGETNTPNHLMGYTPTLWATLAQEQT